MTNDYVILNEREAHEARATAAEIQRVLSTERCFDAIIAGLPPEVVNGYRRAIATEQAELMSVLRAYEAAKAGDYSELKRRAGNDPGLALIVARIARGLTQKELARRLGLKEQQIQRYEADRYRSISLLNYRRIASVLGVLWEMKFSDWIGSGWNIAPHISTDNIRKVVKHGKEHGWFERDADRDAIVDCETYLWKYVVDNIINYGSPALLRTGLNIEDQPDDLLLLAWKSRITKRAESIIEKSIGIYKRHDISWLVELVRLSTAEDAPALAQKFLEEIGIVLIAEPQIPGLKLDGAAFLVAGIPVIGLTVRRDTLDNFWFTLLHEIAHVILHFRTGLQAGFFDDTDITTLEDVEQEANVFASNVLIPDEIWEHSPARIAKSPHVIEKFARQIKIHPAIVFGRVQRERGDYSAYSNNIGRGRVRPYLLSSL